MARTAEQELEKRKAQMLGLLKSKGAEARSIPLSYSALSHMLGITECRTRCSLRTLKAEGKLTVHARYQSNGGQRENAYRITSVGRRWLALVEEGQEQDADQKAKKEGEARNDG